jgi:hypothetical protein
MPVRFRLYLPHAPTRTYLEEGEVPTVADAVWQARTLMVSRLRLAEASEVRLGRIWLEVVDERGAVLVACRLVLCPLDDNVGL